MRVRLLHPDRDVAVGDPLPERLEDLATDLSLDAVVDAMAADDDHVRRVARWVLLAGADDPAVVAHRQAVAADALADPDAFAAMYRVATEALEGRRRLFFGRFGSSPETVLMQARRLLDLLVDALRRLRRVAESHRGRLSSAGMVRLCDSLAEELDDAYLDVLEGHLEELKLEEGVLLSAGLGRGNASRDHVLHRPPRRGWLARMLERESGGLSFVIPERDETAARSLAQLRERGLNDVANILAQSSDHILDFFEVLRDELAFYVGAQRLHRALAQREVAQCWPELTEDPDALAADDLVDAALALRVPEAVGNDVDARGRRLLMVTGANQGGKSTFLRSVGLAQVMAQAGLPVAATRLRASFAPRVLTHHTREEDAEMESGKLDEELRRLSALVDAAEPGDLVLCNESLSSTNEREGSEIARQVTTALLDAGVRVVYVTHLYELARSFVDEPERALLLRAQRGEHGQRPYRLVEGEPLPTSFGADTYRAVFGAELEAEADAGRR